VLALLPADALIEDHATFRRQLGEALERVDEASLLTFAIKPSYPATGFGYLEMDEQLPLGPAGSTFRRVSRFVEKPDLDTATDYVASGHFAWNAGMFVWRAEAFLAEAGKHAPEYAAFIREFPEGEKAAAFIAEKFPHLPKISVDYAIMERAARVIAIKAEFDWDDVGTWTALPAHLSQDALGNTLRGKVAQIESHGNIVVSNGRLVALCGVRDLVVVETPDAILVCHKDTVQDVKKLQPQLPDEVL
jgi:mannose-1-phosphate guanylyltransferase